MERSLKFRDDLAFTADFVAKNEVHEPACQTEHTSLVIPIDLVDACLGIFKRTTVTHLARFTFSHLRRQQYNRSTSQGIVYNRDEAASAQ